MHVNFDLNRIQEKCLNHILCLNRLRELLQESNRPNELLSYTKKHFIAVWVSLVAHSSSPV